MGGEAALPSVLSQDDVLHYRRIFELQADRDWKAADHEIGRLRSHLLMGPVLAQRYLNKYPAKFADLAAWMAAYADLPDAPAIYRLALKQAPRHGAKLRAPRAGTALQGQGSAEAGGRSQSAQWTAGIAAWRLKHYAEAGRSFEAMAKRDDLSGADTAAAAYWAARTHLVNHQPQRVNHWLEIAASYPRTFYGLLARRQLGERPFFAWNDTPLTNRDLSRLAKVPAGKRALALVQVGEDARAERELRRLYYAVDPATASAMLALASKTNMPGLSMRLGALLADDKGQRHDSALYPLPHWEPEEGFQVDRALLFAIARQESGFDPVAHSHAGARGLMQLMPKTAHTMADEDGVSRDELLDPEINLGLGQRYVQQLLNNSKIHGNLILFAAAYNAGVGNVAKWMHKETRKDPLLFIESMPMQETRSFVERVLANYWIYADRLGEAASSLDQVAANDWPVYMQIDAQVAAVIKDVRY